MTAQIGMRRRAEDVKKSIDELRSTVTDARYTQLKIDELTRENVALHALITTMESRMSILETNAAIQTITVAGLQSKMTTAATAPDTVLTSRVDAIEGRVTSIDMNLSTLATTTTQLQDRVGGVESATSNISDRVGTLESRPVPSA